MYAPHPNSKRAQQWVSGVDEVGVMPRYTQPEPEKAILLHKLKLLPQQPPTRIKAKATDFSKAPLKLSKTSASRPISVLSNRTVSILSNLFQKRTESESTSLSEQFSSLEWIEATRDAAIQLWRSSMISMSEAIPVSPRQICDPHRKSLKQLVDEMPNGPAPNIIEQRKQKTNAILKSYGAQMGSYIDSQDKEAKAVLNSVAHLTETLSAFDQRYAVRLQGITKKLRLLATSNDLGEIRSKLDSECIQLEKCLEEQSRDTQGAMQRLTEDVSKSEGRKQLSLAGSSSHQASENLLSFDQAIRRWDRYCLVRYEFQARPGLAIDPAYWKSKEKAILDALPKHLLLQVTTVVPEPGVILAAVKCQLLEYAGLAESMDRSLSLNSGYACVSRVVEPLRGEAMSETMIRLEKAA